MSLYDTVDDVFYGQATDDGDYDDVTIYGAGGEEMSPGAQPAGVMWLAWGYVVGALAFLWAMGAGIFRGSNQS